jgi:hypothetical protein
MPNQQKLESNKRHIQTNSNCMKRWQEACVISDIDKATVRYIALSQLKSTWILDLRLNTVATLTVIHSPSYIGATQSRRHLQHEYAYCSFDVALKTKCTDNTICSSTKPAVRHYAIHLFHTLLPSWLGCYTGGLYRLTSLLKHYIMVYETQAYLHYFLNCKSLLWFFL